jgi:hypothetical protein
VGIFLLTAGVACVLAAIAGGRLKAAQFEIPALGRAWQRRLFGIIGIMLFSFGLYLHYQSPIGPPAGVAVHMNPIHSFSGSCPAHLALTGSVTIAQGQGNVDLHAVLDTAAGQVVTGSKRFTLYFAAPGKETVRDSALIPGSESGDFYWQVVSPAEESSNVATFTVRCSP